MRKAALYSIAVLVMAGSTMGQPVGAWDCCDQGSRWPVLCSGPDLSSICCDTSSLEPCYDTWLPFDEVSGYCMSYDQCLGLVAN